MWTTLAMTAALAYAPAAEGGLSLTNVRPTYGLFGATRKDADDLKLLAGDVIFIGFDIEGLKVAPDGEVQYSMSMEVTNNKDNKVLFKREPEELKAINVLGTSRVPAFAATDIGTDTPPGEYTLTATVTDRAGKANKKIAKKFEVLPKAFGLVRVHLTYTQTTLPAPWQGVVGQSLFVNCAAIHFQRDKDKQPNVVVEMNILDDKGTATLPKPQTVEFNKDIDPKLIGLPVNLLVELNRPGKFTIELQATDKLANKTYKVSLPLQVQEAK
jgi:hypothetical protein